VKNYFELMELLRYNKVLKSVEFINGIINIIKLRYNKLIKNVEFIFVLKIMILIIQNYNFNKDFMI
jgi:hypothetical protein